MGYSIDKNLFQEIISILLQDMVHVCVNMYEPVVNRNDTFKKKNICDDILLHFYLTAFT